jgi:hypothetical protein
MRYTGARGGGAGERPGKLTDRGSRPPTTHSGALAVTTPKFVSATARVALLLTDRLLTDRETRVELRGFRPLTPCMPSAFNMTNGVR